jgi:hypothetical protein
VTRIACIGHAGDNGGILFFRGDRMDLSTLDVEILEEIIQPDKPTLSPSAAKAFLSMRFTDKQRSDMDRLLTKNNAGTITPKQRERLEAYVRVGGIMDLLRLKAELTLKQRSRKL